MRRSWLDEPRFEVTLESFITETMRLIRLGLVRLIAVRARLLAKSWNLKEKHHIYQADALQIVSAKYAKADLLLSGDRRRRGLSSWC